MDLFVYGTLRNAQLLQAVAGGASIKVIPATVADYAVYPVADDVVPLIVAQQGGSVAGLILCDVDPVQQKRLDLFEAAFGYALITVTAQTDAGARAAQMYLPPDDIKVGNGQWSLSDWETNHLAPTLDAVDEVFSHDPMLDAPSLRRMWPMMEMRAWARQRAKAKAPATRRYAPDRGDFRMFNFEPPSGQFFRFDQLTVNRKRFDGTQSDDLSREVFIGTDAVMILPYDAARDRILLVEQFRMGPALRADPNPWVLEPIAGMVDARETPLAAGVREAAEEAGLTITETESMMAFYPSPGVATDYFSCYLGLCDLPETDSYTGGLASENEDLRLHTLGFEQAMALIKTGEINAGPLITMLYWLDRERGRLKP